ncbi:S8 family serine peptidase [Streptomyces sp. DSM 44915]|uniref:S8 family serine peptidase n=1 Tax=Streptomyces chisholmiae TaxID=3075540 RepID=A0ABU2JQQ0_9ACTN|nr:S8 family serine peptidase [Streptomyces sp. DSM 44915]MDT0267315.1 S8 family serine peptidase [Streptomyces sp. DSM 44915]
MKPVRRLALVAALLGLAAVAQPAGAAWSATPQERTGPVANAQAPNAVPGSYLVVLADGRTADDHTLPERYGARVLDSYHNALTGYHVEATPTQARLLAGDPAVARVEQNTAVGTADLTQPAPPSCGLDRIDQPDLPLDGSYSYPDSAGEGVTVYLVDTGIHYGHQDFGGRAGPGYDATGGDGSDDNGHGTHLAGTVGGTEHGVAKRATLVSVKVLDAGGAGTIAGVVGGIDWLTADADGPAVASLGIGGAASTVLDDAVRQSIAAGVSYSVVAGNSGVDAGGISPARVTEAVTTAAATCADQALPSTNHGPAVDLFAPGADIVSTWHTSDTATATLTSGSTAAAHVAGVAALHLADHPTATPAEVWAAIDAAAVLDRLTGVPPNTPNKLLQVVD